MNYLIEFEGYSFSNNFIFKEITISELQKAKSKSFFLKSPYHRKCLSAKEKGIVNFCENVLHKIKWEAGIHQISELKEYLSKVKAGDKVFTKGRQKVEILRKLLKRSILIIDLEELGCQKVSVYLRNIKVIKCLLEKHTDSTHCSFIKVQAYKHFLSKNESFTREEYGVFGEAK